MSPGGTLTRSDKIRAMLDGPILTDREVSARYARVADQDNFEGILEFSDHPLVSTDIQFGWYDNEWGDSDSCRLVD